MVYIFWSANAHLKGEWAMPKPTIYVFAPDLGHPLGGMRMLYRHVDILKANGFEAYIVHSSRKFGRFIWLLLIVVLHLA